MLLKRRGANRNSGSTKLIDKEFSASWKKDDGTLALSIRSVSTTGNGQYNYEISLSIEEIAKIISVVSEQGLIQSPEIVVGKFATSLRPLLRLLIASSGFPTNSKN